MTHTTAHACRHDLTLRFGIADTSGRIVDTVTTRSLVDTVRLFEDLADQGFRCTPGRHHGGTELLRVFVTESKPPARNSTAAALSKSLRAGHHE